MTESLDSKLTRLVLGLEAEFAGGTHRFLLGLAEILELEMATGRGPERIFRRLRNGDYSAKDVSETIRLGLVGGGFSPDLARTLVKRFVDERPLAENVPLAAAIVGARLYGIAEERPLTNVGGGQG